MIIITTKKQGSKAIKYMFNTLSEAKKFMDTLLLNEQLRVAEQRDAPVHAEPKCPACVGEGVVDDGGFIFKCFACDGTGILNRSAGG